MAESWGSQGQPEPQDTALLVLLPAQAHLMPAGEGLQFPATLCTELTGKAQLSCNSSKLIEL